MPMIVAADIMAGESETMTEESVAALIGTKTKRLKLLGHDVSDALITDAQPIRDLDTGAVIGARVMTQLS